MQLLLAVKRVLTQIARRPALPIVLIVLLAAGWSIAYSVLRLQMVIRHPTPFHEPRQLFSVVTKPPNSEDLQSGISPADYRALGEVAPRLGSLAGYLTFNRTLRTTNEARVLQGAAVSSSFFEVLGIPAVFGGVIDPADDRVGAERIAVISESLWLQMFAGSRDLPRGAVLLDDQPVRIVGVIEDQYAFPHGSSIWIALGPEAAPIWRVRNFPIFGAILRARSEISAGTARAELDSLRGATWGELQAVGLDEYLTERVRKPAQLLFGAGLLLLVLCAVTVTGLLTSAGIRERRNLAIEQSAGLTASLLFARYITQALAVGLCAWLAGRAIAGIWLPHIALLFPLVAFDIAGRPAEFEVALLSIATVLLVAVLSSLAVMHDTAGDLGLPQGSLTAAMSRPKRLVWQGLVSLQVGISVALLTAATVLLADYIHLARRDLGFTPSGVVTVGVHPAVPSAKLQGARSEIRTLAAQFTERLEGARVGYTSSLPGSGKLNVAMIRRSVADAPMRADQHVVGGDYFEAVGVSLLRGRVFNRFDGESAMPAAIVDETAARRLFGSLDVLGRQLVLGAANQELSIIGIVSATRQDIHAEPYPTIYLHQEQFPGREAWFVMKGVELPRVDFLLREVQQALGNRVAIHGIGPLSDIVDGTLSIQKSRLLILCLFGVFAAVLSMAGIYTLIASFVAERRTEIGIRLALGEPAGHISWVFLRKMSKAIIIGVGLGALTVWLLRVGIAEVVSEFAVSFLYKVLVSITFLTMGFALFGLIPLIRSIRKGAASLLKEV
ncbi:MAG: ABC transporter permease [Bryobacterales bacterium]|nr:ABC transporter permease [Bryobacterales bacterium]